MYAQFFLFLVFFFQVPSSPNAQAPKFAGTDKWALLPAEYSDAPNLCPKISLRILTGQCTGIRSPTWGQARFAQFSYTTGSSSRTPVRGSISARFISNTIFSQSQDTKNSQKLNQLFVFFGQFIDHNLVSSPVSDTESSPIPVPNDDPTISGTSKLPFRRSVRGRVERSTAERPLNALPSALDLVAVYGPNDRRNMELIELDQFGVLTGRLKTSPGNLLPLNTNSFVNAPDTSSRFFLAGDHRANEHPVLTAFHTLFVREHNYLASLVSANLPGLPPRDIFEFARVLNIAEFQKIVYEEFYPAIIAKPLPRYRAFNSNIDPTVSDIFAGAAFRVGHTMVSNTIPRQEANGDISDMAMKDIFFRPAREFSSRMVDLVLRGTANTCAQEIDAMVVDVLRNQLFENVRGEEGFDLVALNIQRGRDHALPTYNELRKMFGIPKARSMEDITSDPFTSERLSRAYSGNVNEVEAFVGLMAEDHVRNSGVGRTMSAIWEREFIRLRDGDQFFYLRTEKFPEQIRAFLKEVVDKISKPGGITLRDIIARNTGIKESQLPRQNIFKSERACRSLPQKNAASSSQSECEVNGSDECSSTWLQPETFLFAPYNVTFRNCAEIRPRPEERCKKVDMRSSGVGARVVAELKDWVYLQTDPPQQWGWVHENDIRTDPCQPEGEIVCEDFRQPLPSEFRTNYEVVYKECAAVRPRPEDACIGNLIVQKGARAIVIAESEGWVYQRTNETTQPTELWGWVRKRRVQQ